MLSLLFSLLITSAGAEPIAIPAGSFVQGSGRATDAPTRTVQLSAYSIDATEVSIAEFEQFVAAGWTDPQWWSASGRAWQQAQSDGAGASARAAGRPADHPVVRVTYWEAEAYCRWRGGALPTEAQWEHAACGSGGQRYPWGDSDERDVVWYSGGKFGHLSSVRTRAVHDAPPDTRSLIGGLHMAGNVWEWTADVYHRDGTRSEAVVTDPSGPESGPWRVLKGGSFMNLPSYCSCTHREPARPERQAFTTGFRCAYSSSETPP